MHLFSGGGLDAWLTGARLSTDPASVGATIEGYRGEFSVSTGAYEYVLDHVMTKTGN